MTFRVLQKTRCVVGYFYILKFCPPGCNQQKNVLYLQPNRKNSATFVSVILFPGTNMCAVSLFRQLSLDSSDYHPVIITGAVTRMWEDRGEAPEFQKKNSNCWPDERQTWWKSSAHVLILTSITGGIQIIQIMNECQPAVHRCDTCCCSWPHLLLALRLQWEKKKRSLSDGIKIHLTNSQAPKHNHGDINCPCRLQWDHTINIGKAWRLS